jgi:hypothetical protein
MTGNDVVTTIGEKVCALAEGASGWLGEPYLCAAHEYFDTGAATMALWALMMVVALLKIRQRYRRLEDYR